MSKTLFTLNVDNYSPEIQALTMPLIKGYARKIGATHVEITERKFPMWPVTYEKLQIYELARKHGSEWNIYIDSDALVHPETLDWTCYIPKDTVAHNGIDFANVRWTYDKYFRRDGRNIGSCNWMTIASDWCLDLWRPLDDITLDEILNNIHPTVEEQTTGLISREHLIDDYALSRNIARFGLKATTLSSIEKKLGFDKAEFFWHSYTIPANDKVEQMQEVLKRWKILA